MTYNNNNYKRTRMFLYSVCFFNWDSMWNPKTIADTRKQS